MTDFHIPTLSESKDIAARFEAARSQSAGGPYSAMYSSWLGGIITEPAFMTVPVDDHLVHRGDGVFETLLVYRGGLIALDGHLDRLFRSATTIGIQPPMDREQLGATVIATVRAGGQPDCLVRVMVSRGPGGFAVNPYECPVPGLYIVVYPASAPFMEKHPQGAKIAFTDLPLKPNPILTIKTCNYLLNALMKKEAVDRGVDFLVALDEECRVSESFTENICYLDRQGVLRAPQADQMLEGITLQRLLHHARLLAEEGLIHEVRRESFTPADLTQAREVFIAGTTAHITAVTSINGQPVADGKPGRVHGLLAERFSRDLNEPSAFCLRVF